LDLIFAAVAFHLVTLNFAGGQAMNEIVRKPIPVPSAQIPPAIASMHPTYRSAAIQASAALHNLTTQFRLKNARRPGKTGRAYKEA